MRKAKSISNLFYYLCLFLIASAIMAPNAQANDRYTHFRAFLGFSINGNMYDSKFSRLTDDEPSLVDFSSATGIGFSIFAGGEYLFQTRFLGMDWRYNFMLGFSDLTAEYKEEEFIGHIIKDQSYSDGTSEHLITPSINSLYLDQGFIVYPFESMPLGFRAGISAGLLMGMTFEQSESLVDPSDPSYTYENGKRVRNVHSGDLPGPASMALSASLGVRYDAYEFSSFVLTPFLQLNYGLTDAVGVDKWKIHSANLGISLNYRFSKPEMIEPAPPPPPPLPVPPSAAELALRLEAFSGDNNLEQNSNVNIMLYAEEYVQVYSVLPAIFFPENSALYMKSFNQNAKGYLNAQKTVLTGIVDYLKENPNTKVTLTALALDSEEKGLAEKRIESVSKLLTGNGVSADRIKSKKEIIKSSKLDNPELHEENRAVWFSFSDNTSLIKMRGDSNLVITSDPVNLKVTPVVNADAGLASFSGEISANGQQIATFDDKGIDWNYKIDDNEFNPDYEAKLNIIAKAIDSEGKTATAALEVQLFPILKKIKKNENYISNSAKYGTREFILGYCDFDVSAFHTINKDILKIVKKAYKDGCEIQLLPLTDISGTEEHNGRLARLRAESALRALGLSKENVEILYPDEELFDNATPHGRILSRSVVVRIKDKK